MVPHTFIVEHDWGYVFCETCKLTFSLAGRQFVVCKLALRAYWSPEVLAMYIWTGSEIAPSWSPMRLKI